MGKKAQHFTVARVLLSDGWHGVLDDSFQITAMVFADESGASVTFSDWFTFTEHGTNGRHHVVRGRIDALLALQNAGIKPDYLK